MSGKASASLEWRGAWMMPIVGATGLTLNAFHIYSLGVFVDPIQRELGWTRAEITLGLSITSALSLLIVPLVGLMIDRFGARRIAIPAVMLYCAAVALLGTTGASDWNWWLLWGLLSLGSSATSPVLWTTAVTSRFDAARGMALAVTLCGSGLSSICAPLLAAVLLAKIGWRDAYLSSGAIMAAVALPMVVGWFYGHSDLERLRPETSRKPESNRTTLAAVSGDLRSSPFLRLAISGFLLMIGMSALMVHFVHSLQMLGLTTGEAASAAAFLGVGSITGRLIGGVLLDRTSAAILGAIAFSLPCVVSLAMLFLVHDLVSACVVALILGLSLGCEMDVLAYIASRLFRLGHFGRLFSVIIALTTAAYAVGPTMGSLAYDLSGEYGIMLVAIVPVFVIAAALVLSLKVDLSKENNASDILIG